MAFINEPIPPSRHEELKRFAPFGNQPTSWIVDADRQAFMVEAGLEPPKRTAMDEYPLRFYFSVEGKVIVFDAFQCAMEQRTRVRWYADTFLIPKGLSGRIDELRTLVADAMQKYSESKDNARVKKVEVVACPPTYYGILGWRKSCPILFRSARQRDLAAPAFLSGFVSEPIPVEERWRLGVLEHICKQAECWVINRDTDSMLIECPTKRSELKHFALITPKTILHVLGTEFSPRLPYLNECDIDFEHPFRSIIMKALWAGPSWLTDGQIVMQETDRARAEELRQLGVEALSAQYSRHREFTERRTLDLRITLDDCEYYQGTPRDMCRAFFPALFSCFHNEPIPAGRSEVKMIANIFTTFNHEYLGEYKDGKWLSRGNSISEWFYQTVSEEEDFSLVWFGPIFGDREERLPALYQFCLQSSRERFIISHKGHTACFDAFYHATETGDGFMRIYWHGGVLHLSKAMRKDEKNIRRLLAEALRAHGRYYVSRVSDIITLDLWETRFYPELGPNPKSMHGDDLLEKVDHRSTESVDAQPLNLVRQAVSPADFPQLTKLIAYGEKMPRANDCLCDRSARVALLHVEHAGPHNGERYGTERDSFWLLIEDSTIKISGVSMRGTSRHFENAFFFEDMLVYESSGRWGGRLSEVLRIFRVCIAAKEKCPLHNVQLLTRER